MPGTLCSWGLQGESAHPKGKKIGSPEVPLQTASRPIIKGPMSHESRLAGPATTRANLHIGSGPGPAQKPQEGGWKGGPGLEGQGHT